MKIVINVPDYVKEQADDGKGEELGIPLWLAYEIANGKTLPKGHGRLIDADDFKKKVCTYQQTGCGDCKHSLCCPEDVPTIIEADIGESEDTE